MRVPIRSFRGTNGALVRTHTGIILVEHVISSTEPRAQAISKAAAVQTSKIFGVLAVFEVLHSLILHDESSFRNYSGTRIPVSVLP